VYLTISRDLDYSVAIPCDTLRAKSAAFFRMPNSKATLTVRTQPAIPPFLQRGPLRKRTPTLLRKLGGFYPFFQNRLQPFSPWRRLLGHVAARFAGLCGKTITTTKYRSRGLSGGGTSPSQKRAKVGVQFQ